MGVRDGGRSAWPCIVHCRATEWPDMAATCGHIRSSCGQEGSEIHPQPEEPPLDSIFLPYEPAEPSEAPSPSVTTTQHPRPAVEQPRYPSRERKPPDRDM